jgi:type II secretory pathway component GspD/PulD (secretin)
MMKNFVLAHFSLPFLLLTGACRAQEKEAEGAVSPAPVAVETAPQKEVLAAQTVAAAPVSDETAPAKEVLAAAPDAQELVADASLSAPTVAADASVVKETVAEKAEAADPAAPAQADLLASDGNDKPEDLARKVATAVSGAMATNGPAIAAAVEAAVGAAVETNAIDLAAVVSAATKAAEAARHEAAAAAKRAEEEKAEAALDARRISTRVFTLSHADADEVAELFNATWSGDFGATWKVKKIASSFPEANAVMVTAPKMILAACEEVVRQVDVEARQVYIEARFVELSNNASHKLGIDWQMLDGMKGSLSLDAGWNERKIEGVTKFDSQTGAYTIDTSQSPGRSSANLSHVNGTIGMSELSVILRALETSEDARTFSNPKIIVSSGKRAMVDMTTKYPNVQVAAKKTYNTSGSSTDLDMKMAAIPGEDKFMFAKEAFFSWGISLEVTPRIGTNGLINVTIVPTISDCQQYVTAGTGDSEGEEAGYSSKYPIINVQRLVTEFNLASETTAVIGGLSRTIETQKDTGIPWLRDWWWIGPRLFGSKERVKEQKEIIVFVTVGLVNPQEIARDAGLPKNAVLGRQYTDGTRREPGDRIRQRAEGMRSLDLRTLEDQYADPRRTNTVEAAKWSLDSLPKPFSKDPHYKTKETTRKRSSRFLFLRS